jgi:hypothetical protein
VREACGRCRGSPRRCLACVGWVWVWVCVWGGVSALWGGVAGTDRVHRRKEGGVAAAPDGGWGWRHATRAAILVARAPSMPVARRQLGCSFLTVPLTCDPNPSIDRAVE